MKRLVVFVPGIMGSRLGNSEQAGGGLLWHEDFIDSLSKLVDNPPLFKWYEGNSLRPVGVISKVLLKKMGIKVWSVDICDVLRMEMLRSQTEGQIIYDEFPYDWRQDITLSAKRLGEWLRDKHGFSIDGEGKQEKEEAPRLCVIAHSMGGLVTSAAMMAGNLHPDNVYRFIAVGTPFLGAPAAFRALFTTGYIPGMKWFERALYWRRDRRLSTRALLDTFQTYLSIYQLLPPLSVPFVRVGEAEDLIHPLDGLINNEEAKDAAIRVHEIIAQFQEFLRHNGEMKFHFISGEDTDNTDYVLYVSSRRDAYLDVCCNQRTSGDGTVPAFSSALNRAAGCNSATVIGASHSQMCSHRKVLALVRQFIV